MFSVIARAGSRFLKLAVLNNITFSLEPLLLFPLETLRKCVVSGYYEKSICPLCILAFLPEKIILISTFFHTRICPFLKISKNITFRFYLPFTPSGYHDISSKSMP